MRGDSSVDVVDANGSESEWKQTERGVSQPTVTRTAFQSITNKAKHLKVRYNHTSLISLLGLISRDRNAFSPDSAKQFLNPVILASSKVRELIIE